MKYKNVADLASALGADESRVRDLLATNSIALQDVDDVMLEALQAELQTAIAPVTGGKVSPMTGGNVTPVSGEQDPGYLSTGKPRPVLGINRSVQQTHGGGGLGREIDRSVSSFKENVKEGVRKLEDTHVEDLAQWVADSPYRVIEKFNDRVAGLKHDPEHFRQLGREFVEGVKEGMRSGS